MMRLSFLCLALALTTAVACSDDDDSSDDNGGSGGKGNGGDKSDGGDAEGGRGSAGAGSSQSASTKIAAAKGGKVVLGKASLNIPAGSLASDATITVETSAPSSDLPDSDSVKGLVYDFGPDGTEFSEPAKLTLPSAGKPGADEEAVIAWLDEDKDAWQDLATTVNADGSLTAEVMHFTNFAVRFNGVVSSDCDFSACGGADDLVGTWKVTGVCAEIAEAIIDVCPTAVATLDLTLSGTATFEADGTRSTDFTSKSTITYTLSAECLNTITKGMPPASCDVLSKEADPAMGDGPTTCTGDPAVACTCVAEDPEKSETKTGTYTIDGNTLTSKDDADDSMSVSEFCVKGTEARFQQPEDKAVLTWIAKKQ